MVKPVFKFIKKPSEINEEFRKLPKIKEEEREDDNNNFDNINLCNKSVDEMDLGTINFTINFD